jgi:transcriptional regulator with XRE-family HTH domain
LPATSEQHNSFDFSPESIRARRLELCLEQERLAVATGCSVRAVMSWEDGTRSPRARVRPLILSALRLAERDDAVVALVRRVRAEQGLPELVESPETIERIAAILRGTGGGGRDAAA